jgi:hypothetical protein
MLVFLGNDAFFAMSVALNLESIFAHAG